VILSIAVVPSDLLVLDTLKVESAKPVEQKLLPDARASFHSMSSSSWKHSEFHEHHRKLIF
jgi:hypothetical protein